MHTYTYDSARRLARDGATTIPSGVDDHVKSIARTYDDLGRVVTVTSYENNDGTGSVRNQVKYTYNYLGKVSQIDQDHADAVGSGLPARPRTAARTRFTIGARFMSTPWPAGCGPRTRTTSCMTRTTT